VTKNTPVSPPPEHQPRHVRYSARWQARLDEETHAKIEELARTLHRKRGAVLRFVMGWGLTHTQGWTVKRSIPVTEQTVGMLLEPELLQQVQDAAAARGVSIAAWLRHAIRQVTRKDFPRRWRAEESALRSHESGYYHRKFGLRLDEVTSRKLDALCQTFHRSAAEVIRQLINQATPEDFPESWVMAANEHHAQY
jgi:predicted transcriptional regulator